METLKTLVYFKPQRSPIFVAYFSKYQDYAMCLLRNQINWLFWNYEKWILSFSKIRLFKSTRSQFEMLIKVFKENVVKNSRNTFKTRKWFKKNGSAWYNVTQQELHYAKSYFFKVLFFKHDVSVWIQEEVQVNLDTQFNFIVLFLDFRWQNIWKCA